jgi:hypothetical protein
MHDLKLTELQQFDRVPRNPPQASSLPDIDRPYARSVTNIYTLAIFPALATGTATFLEHLEAQALLTVTGNIERLPDPDSRQALVRNEHLHLLKNFAAKPPRAKLLLQRGFDHLLLLTDHAEIADGLQVYLSAMIINAWSAFETMAGDLWEAALNAHPHSLSDLKGDRKRITESSVWATKDTARQVGQRPDLQKTVPLTLLQEHGYDLHKKMGRVLRDRMDFARLNGIREAYSLAFSGDSTELDQALSNDSLDALSSLRNLLAHRAGRVDDEYLNIAPKIPSCLLAKKGENLQLDGEIVARLAVPVLECGWSLIGAVDRWITTYPDKTRAV